MIVDVDDEWDLEIAGEKIVAISALPVMSWAKMREETASDKIMLELMVLIEEGFLEDKRSLTAELRPYAPIKDGLYIVDGVIMLGSRIVVPPSLRESTLQALYATHQSVSVM